MKSIIALIFSLFFASFLLAQDPITPRGSTYFFLGLGFPMAKVRDQGHSSLLYKGINPTLRIGYERMGTDVVSRITSVFHQGKSNPKRDRSRINNCQALKSPV